LVEPYILETRISPRSEEVKKAAAEALKTPVAKAPETPKSTKTIVETPTTAKKVYIYLLYIYNLVIYYEMPNQCTLQYS
jgi:hypothetical protein